MYQPIANNNPESPESILSRFCGHIRDSFGHLLIEGEYIDLLAQLGNPHLHLPPVIHVAGTNGKGSTCAFIRAACEAAGYRAHVYTSPHLVRLHERIRIAGKLISEDDLVAGLHECEAHSQRGTISYFETLTAVAFAAFARHPADVTVLEVGLGGRLDATNVVADNKVATVITRLSYDHCQYLGDTMTEIAGEKAGIMRHNVPCFTAPQPSGEAMAALQQKAATIDCPLIVGGHDWTVVPSKSNDGFHFSSATRDVHLPLPALTGHHQLWNAGLAIAALDALPFTIPDAAISKAMTTVEWPARLQHLTTGSVASLLPEGWELWLDGGHNDSAGEALAAQMAAWQRQDAPLSKPLFVIFGMLKDKDVTAFLRPLAPYIEKLLAIDIENEPLSASCIDLAKIATSVGIPAATTDGVADAIASITAAAPVSAHGRILICGSLYLAGQVLRKN